MILLFLFILEFKERVKEINKKKINLKKIGMLLNRQ